MTEEQITTALTWLVAVAFPLVVGFVTTKETNSLVKALLLATISFASGFVSQLLAAIVAHTGFVLTDALLTGAGAWLFAVCSHKEIWTRTNIIGALQQMGVKPRPGSDAPKHSA